MPVSRIKSIIKDILPDPAVDILFALRKHKQRHGKFPSLVRPQTFNEKIVHRKLFDRRPLLTQFADKYAVRAYVAERLGEDILPQLYFSTVDPSNIPFDTLPDKFVVKPTHGSGWVRIVTDKSQLDRNELVNICKSWLGESFYKGMREWPYKNIPPRIIIEEFIDDGSGDSPNDYKLFVFGGRVEIIQVDVSRFKAHQRNIYDRNWNQINVKFLYPHSDAAIKLPIHLTDMIDAAEMLCKGIDFVRADFYDTQHRIYFGELTTTPECGLGVFDPVSFDHQLGRFWKL